VLLLLLVVLTGRLGSVPLCVLVALICALGALELATALKRQGAAVPPLAAAAGGAAFPVGAYLWGEPGILAVAALVFVGYSGALTVRGLKPDTVRTLASLLLPALYVGVGGSFVVLIHRSAQGTTLLEVFLGILLAYRLGFWVGSRGADPLSEMPSLFGVSAGSLASLVAAPPLGLLLRNRPGLGAVMVVGLLVGLAATIGTLAGTLFTSPEKPGVKAPPRPVLSQTEAALLAAPAFFYAFRVLLT
jgi:CDP-diglyceride synthetase